MSNEPLRLDDTLKETITKHLGADLLAQVEQRFQEDTSLTLRALPALAIESFQKLHPDHSTTTSARRAERRFSTDPSYRAIPAIATYADHVKTAHGTDTALLFSYMLQAPCCPANPDVDSFIVAARAITKAAHFKSKAIASTPIADLASGNTERSAVSRAL